LALSQFQELRRCIMPFAEAQGLQSDEKIFREIS
jgi:hypothetical protein